MKLDMNALMKQAQQMQEQMAQAQEAAKDEIAEASAGGGMVTAKANGAGELVEIRIDPRAIDPDDPEMLADMVSPRRTRRSAPPHRRWRRSSGARCPTSAAWDCRGSRATPPAHHRPSCTRPPCPARTDNVTAC